MHNIIVLMPWLHGLKKIKERELCRPYLGFYPPLDIFENNMVTISLIHSHFPLTMWKDDNLGIFLNEERKACPLTTESSFVHFRSTLLKLKFMADPGLWFATNS